MRIFQNKNVTDKEDWKLINVNTGELSDEYFLTQREIEQIADRNDRRHEYLITKTKKVTAEPLMIMKILSGIFSTSTKPLTT